VSFLKVNQVDSQCHATEMFVLLGNVLL